MKGVVTNYSTLNPSNLCKCRAKTKQDGTGCVQAEDRDLKSCKMLFRSS